MQMSVSVSGCHTVHSSKSMLISMLIKECVYPSPQVRAAQYLLFHAFCLIPKLIFDKVSCILTFTEAFGLLNSHSSQCFWLRQELKLSLCVCVFLFGTIFLSQALKLSSRYI